MSESNSSLEGFVAPQFQASAFNCPHCGSFNQQDWYLSAYHFESTNFNGNRHDQNGIVLARCFRCHNYSLWLVQEKRIIYPGSSPAPRTHKDMPSEVASDYNEARDVVAVSPRGAAALLRLAAEKLTHILVAKVQPDKAHDLNEGISILVGNGLPTSVQRAMDTLRIIGNEAVHPGVLDLRDDRDTALRLFRLVNVVVENQISERKEIDALYLDKLPDAKREAIEKRDQDKLGPA